MLVSNITGITVQPNTETVVAEWTADGVQALIGFTGTGTYSGNFRCRIIEIDNSTATPTEKEVGGYIYQTSPSNRTAYIVDRAFIPAAGTIIRLTVEHDAVDIQNFYGTILGGGY